MSDTSDAPVDDISDEEFWDRVRLWTATVNGIATLAGTSVVDAERGLRAVIRKIVSGKDSSDE